MNRRGFIGLVTAAAVAPQELIAAPDAAPVLSEAALESILIEIPKHVGKISILPTRFIVPAAFIEQLREILNEEFSGLYECIPWEGIFEDQKALASEVGSGDSADGEAWRKNSEGTAEADEFELGRALRLHRHPRAR